MKTGIILGLSNTKDSKWYRLVPEDSTLRLLDEIFDLADKLYEENSRKIYSYKFKTAGEDITLNLDAKDVRAYIILTKNAAHLIIRKCLKWKKFEREMEKRFKFSSETK